MRVVPGEWGPLSCIKGISELFDSVVLTREAEDALLIQAVFFDELHTLLHQDGNHMRSKPLLVCYRVHETLSKHFREAEREKKTSVMSNQKSLTIQINIILAPFQKGSMVITRWCLCFCWSEDISIYRSLRNTLNEWYQCSLLTLDKKESMSNYSFNF